MFSNRTPAILVLRSLINAPDFRQAMPLIDRTVPFILSIEALMANLFFEYVEGLNNKALEIYNGTGAAIDLAAYAARCISTAVPLLV